MDTLFDRRYDFGVEPDRTLPYQRDPERPIRAVRVTVVAGPDKGQSRTSADALTIGTAPGNDLTLSDETVSRHHAELLRDGDRILVVDHGSTNSTMAAGVRIERGAITAGMSLKLGKTTLKVDDGETVGVALFPGDRLCGLIGSTPPMRELMARIERAAASNASVLLLGETGTGKEVAARAIHERSPRASEPFEVVDCGAMLPTLIASELFGHEKGAFTGADERHIGSFERAHGGTLFLDEIGELPTAVQSALLGAIERREFRRLGGKESIPADVRLVCATHRDLRSEVNAGTFRQDLYYRIAVILLRIPPLRDRVDDIPLLTEHFARAAGYQGPLEDVLPENVLASFRAHRWPGNVRELRNTIEAALVMGEPTLFADAPGEVEQTGGTHQVSLDSYLSLPYNEAKAALVDHFEELFVRELLERCDDNVTVAAQQAKMSRSHLTKLIARMGLTLRRTPKKG